MIVASIAANLLPSCIIKQACTFLIIEGVTWQAAVGGTAKLGGNTILIFGTYAECKEKADDELLDEADENDPLYVAIKDELLSSASVNCVTAAQDAQYTDIVCDPFSEGTTSSLVPLGPCPEDLKLLDGNPATCLGDESGGGTLGSETSEVIPTTTESTTPTTTAGDSTAGGEGTSGDDSGTTAAGWGDLDSLITCTQTTSTSTCLVSQDLIDAVMADPLLLLDEPTRLIPYTGTSTQVLGMAFDGVATGSLADKLGFANGDVILAVEELPFIEESDFLAAAVALYDATTVTVTVERRFQTSELTFTRD